MMNSELKSQIEELKHERQQLILMLNRHRPTCIVRTDSIKSPEKEANPLLEQVEAEWEGPTHFHVTVYRLALLQLAEALGLKHLDILRKVGELRLNKATRKTHWWWPQYIGLCVGSYKTFMGMFFPCKTFFFFGHKVPYFSLFRKELSIVCYEFIKTLIKWLDTHVVASPS